MPPPRSECLCRAALHSWPRIIEGSLEGAKILGKLIVDRQGQDSAEGLPIDVDSRHPRVARRDEPGDRPTVNGHRERLPGLRGPKNGADVVAQLTLRDDSLGQSATYRSS